MSSKQPKKPRLSLTKTQIQAGIGAELLALCQSITEDGSLSKDDIIALKSWLEANRSCDLPAIGFLITTVERILADGKVTKEEHKELYKAIEAVLPPEARRQAAEQRSALEMEEKVRARSEREVQKQREWEEQELKRPLCSANFMVAGVHYEGRPEVIRRHVEEDDQIFLARDPHNKYSRNAVEVRLQNGMQIGYVPEDDAIDIAPLLDQGCPHHAYVTKVLTGGRVPIPVVQAYVYRADAGVEDTVFQGDVPEKRRYSRRPGCLSVLLLGVVSLLLGLVILVKIWG